MRWRKRATPALSAYTRGAFPVSGLSMNSACPCPAGDHSTRQWLTRSTIVLPPSSDRRTNEFSPVITTSWGSTIRRLGHGALLSSKARRIAPRSAGRWRRRATPSRDFRESVANFLSPAVDSPIARPGARATIPGIPRIAPMPAPSAACPHCRAKLGLRTLFALGDLWDPRVCSPERPAPRVPLLFVRRYAALSGEHVRVLRRARRASGRADGAARGPRRRRMVDADPVADGAVLDRARRRLQPAGDADPRIGRATPVAGVAQSPARACRAGR